MIKWFFAVLVHLANPPEGVGRGDHHVGVRVRREEKQLQVQTHCQRFSRYVDKFKSHNLFSNCMMEAYMLLAGVRVHEHW